MNEPLNELMIVFPKEFEFHKFILEFEVVLIYPKQDYTEYHFLIDKEVKRVNCRIIHESDIEFAIKLSELMAKYSRMYWMLVGSCGVDSDEKVDLMREENKVIGTLWSSSFWVSKATKIDRGELRSVHQSVTHLFTPRTDKIVEVKHDRRIPLLGVSREVFCCNSLVLTQNKDNKVYDMESYEFLKLAKINSILCLGVLRIITDVCSFPFNKLMRVSTSFKSAVVMFKQLSYLFPPSNIGRRSVLDTNSAYYLKSLLNTQLIQHPWITTFLERWDSDRNYGEYGHMVGTTEIKQTDNEIKIVLIIDQYRRMYQWDNSVCVDPSDDYCPEEHEYAEPPEPYTQNELSITVVRSAGLEAEDLKRYY